jgi:hypothetical protein
MGNALGPGWDSAQIKISRSVHCSLVSMFDSKLPTKQSAVALQCSPRHPRDIGKIGQTRLSQASLALASQPRAKTLRTLLGYQLPPRAVATPRELRESAICCSVVAPAFFTCFKFGSTVRSASALPASPPLPRMASRSGFAQLHTACFGSCQRRLSMLRDQRARLFCQGRGWAHRGGHKCAGAACLKEGSISAPPDRRAPLSEDKLSLR